MKPVAFDYDKAVSLQDAGARLAAGGGGCKVIAGGQSLGAMLNLRLVRPERLVDVRELPELRRVEETAQAVRYGAALRHAEFEDGAVPDAARGMLAHVAGLIAYRAVRNRGTLGGSLAHADPAADWVLTLPALDARVHLSGPAGPRSLEAHAFFLGAFTTALRDGEILAAVEVPRLSATAAWGYYKICRKVGEFAEASAAVVVDPERGACRVVAGALDGAPALLEEVADLLAGQGAAAALAALPDAVARILPDAGPVKRRQHEVALKRAIRQVYPQ